MSESFERPKKPIYPTMEEAMELQRIADTRATGANVHKVKGEVSKIYLQVEISKILGWNEERLKIFNECKKRLFEILSGFPPTRE